MPSSSVSEILDVVIVGVGAAGLSAALVLRRCLRRVLVCDAGSPRNAPARIFNGYLSRDGSTPGEFLQIGRDQLQRYETVELRQAKVTHAERGDRRFTVTLESGERIDSRLLLLATGLVDELPQIEGFMKFYGKTAHNCPYCDAWEQQLGCEFCAEDGCIQCDEKAATCIPGLYAAGNASRGVQLVIAAAAEGTLAAVAMNNALVEADAESGALGA
ncbi:MAG: hypothetical protein QOE70_1391 [Chthoniobacter sp.]|nr:hypothetical protein [Chthoniobacter sp.]